MALKFGDHVAFTPGAHEEQVVGHVVKVHDNSHIDIQTLDGVERNIPRREQSVENEDLGRTWQAIP